MDPREWQHTRTVAGIRIHERKGASVSDMQKAMTRLDRAFTEAQNALFDMDQLIAAAPEINEAIEELKWRYDAYAQAVVDDIVGDTTGSLERRVEALEALLVAVRAILGGVHVDA